MTPEELKAHIASEIDSRLDEKLGPMKTQLDEIVRLMAKFEGAGTVMKLLFLGVAPIVGGVIWLKDHVRL